MSEASLIFREQAEWKRKKEETFIEHLPCVKKYTFQNQFHLVAQITLQMW